jgi:ankyrin repeat protein
MEQRMPAVELVDISESKESKQAKPTLGTTLLDQLYAGPESCESAINTLLEIASQLSLDKQKEFVTTYRQHDPALDLRELQKAYSVYAKNERSFKEQQAALIDRRTALYTVLKQLKEWYINEGDPKAKKRFKKQIKEINEKTVTLNKEYANLKEATYKDQKKSAVKAALTKVYQQIQTRAAHQQLPKQADMHKVLEDLCTSPQGCIGNLFTAPLVKLESKHEEPTPLELRHAFQSNINIADCLYVSSKSGGANDPGRYGGNYLLCYQTADGKIHSQIIFFKQATDHGLANHRENIAEVIAGHIMNGIVGNHAAAIMLAMPNKELMKAGSNPEATYVGSLFFKDFSDFHTAAHQAINRPAGKRGKAAYGGQEINHSLLGNPYFQPGFIRLAETFNVTNLSRALMANLLVGNYQIHTQNGGLARLTGEKQPVTFDFGGAFRRRFVTRNFKAKEQPGQFPKAVQPYQAEGRKYNAAYLLAFPKEIRESKAFIDGIDDVANFNSDRLREHINAAVDYQVRYYGIAAFIKHFAQALDTTQQELDFTHIAFDENAQLEATKNFLYNRLFARQLSLRRFSLQQKLGHPDYDHAELRERNPIYCKYALTKDYNISQIKGDIKIMTDLLADADALPGNSHEIHRNIQNLRDFLGYASVNYSFYDQEDLEIISQALNESHQAVMKALQVAPDAEERRTILETLRDKFCSTVEVTEVKPDHKHVAEAKLDHKREVSPPQSKNSEIPYSIFSAATQGRLRELQDYFASDIGKMQSIHINIPDEQGYTLLMYAAAKGHASVVRYLLSIMSPAEIEYAVRHLKSLQGRSPLLLAVERSSFYAEEYTLTAAALLATGYVDINEVYPDDSGDTALTRAAKLGNVRLIQYLLAAPGIRASHQNAQGNDALIIAVQRGDSAIVNALLATQGQGANASLSRALFIAIQRQDIVAIQRLAQAGANVNQPLPDAATPLLSAIQHGRYFAARQLLELGVDLQHIPVDMAFPDPNPNTEDHRQLRDVLHAVHRQVRTPVNLNNLDNRTPPKSRANSGWKKVRKLAEILFWLIALTTMGLAVASLSVFSFGLPAVVVALLPAIPYLTVAFTALSSIMLRFKLMDNVDSNWDQLFLDLYPEVEYRNALNHAKTLAQHRPLSNLELDERAKPKDFALPASPAEGNALELNPEQREKLLNLVNSALNALMVRGERRRIAQYALPAGVPRENERDQLQIDISHLLILQTCLQRLKENPQGKNVDVIAATLNRADFRAAYREFKGEDDIETDRADNSTILGRLRNTTLHPKSMMDGWFGKQWNKFFSWRAAGEGWFWWGLKRFVALPFMLAATPYWLVAGIERLGIWANSPIYPEPAAAAAQNLNAFLPPQIDAANDEAANDDGDWINLQLNQQADLVDANNLQDPLLGAPDHVNLQATNHRGKTAVRWIFNILAAAVSVALLFVITALTLAMFDLSIGNKLIEFIINHLLGNSGDAATIAAKTTVAPAMMGGFVGGGGLVLLGISKAALSVNATSYNQFKPVRDKLLHDQEIRLQHLDTERPVDFGFKNRIKLWLSASTFGFSEVLHRNLRPYRVCIGYNPDGTPIGEEPASLNRQQWWGMAKAYYNPFTTEGRRNLLRSFIKFFALGFIIGMSIALATLGGGWIVAGPTIGIYVLISAFKGWRNYESKPRDTRLDVAAPPVALAGSDYELVPEPLAPAPGSPHRPLSPAERFMEDDDEFGTDSDIEAKGDKPHEEESDPEDSDAEELSAPTPSPRDHKHAKPSVIVPEEFSNIEGRLRSLIMYLSLEINNIIQNKPTKSSSVQRNDPIAQFDQFVAGLARYNIVIDKTFTRLLNEALQKRNLLEQLNQPAANVPINSSKKEVEIEMSSPSNILQTLQHGESKGSHPAAPANIQSTMQAMSARSNTNTTTQSSSVFGAMVAFFQTGQGKNEAPAAPANSSTPLLKKEATSSIRLE